MSWEIIVVDDGGGDFDDTALVGAGPIRLIRLPVNRGKGAAVAAGMRVARGRVRIFTDVDLPYDPELIPVISEYILDGGFHMVVGDRTLPTSKYSARVGWRRRTASALFSAFVGTLVTGGFFDTQCGLKGIRGDVADAMFALTRIGRFTFDVELIYLALTYRIDVKRIPVELRNNETSSVRLLRDACTAVVDMFRIKYFQLTGCYRSAMLASIVSNDFERTRAAVADRIHYRSPTGSRAYS